MIAVLRQRNFSLLWFAGLISMIGDWMLRIALPVYIFELTNSTLATGLMFMVSTLPRLLFGSIAGVFVDRWDRRRTMIAANFLMALGLLPLLLVNSLDSLWIIYVVAFVQALISQFFGPAENALLPGITIALILFVLVGIPGAGFSGSFSTLAQSNVADAYRGRIFGAFDTTFALMMLVGMGFASVSGDVLGIVPVLNIQGFGYVAAGLLALVMLRPQLTILSPYPRKSE